MYYIIEKKEQLDYLIRSTDGTECFINVIPLNDNYHPALTSTCLIYFKPINDKGYIICINHSESLSVSMDDVYKLLEEYNSIWCIDLKFHKYFLNVIDRFSTSFKDVNHINSRKFEHNVTTLIHEDYYRKFPDLENINKIIPISKHFEKQELIYEKIGGDDQFVKNFTYPSTFYEIEKNGIKIDLDHFFKYYEPQNEKYSIKNDKIYTHYNLYNTTGRPSNAFNGINFAAIPKENRRVFIPENDLLVEMDYDCFHPRLIDDYISQGFFLNNKTPGHEQLASFYFDTDHPTKEQIDESKKYTFKQLYGGIEDKWKTIPFFLQIDHKIDDIWETYKKNGFLSLYGGRHIYDMTLTKNKMFNYLVQSLETYYNVARIDELNDLLRETKSKLIHYNYDSFLFDIADEENYILDNIYEILSERFPVKISYGKNYRDMQKHIIQP